MARFDILSSGGAVRYTGAPTYNGVFGKASYLEFQQIASPYLITWEVGDYIDYPRTGLRYKLYSIPQPERHAKSGKRGDSIIYRNVQLFSATKDLEICPFNDLVLGDNLIHYSSQPDVNTYENVQGIADRIQANLDSFYGEGLWEIRLYDSDEDVAAIMAEAKEFSVSDGSCMDALDAIYNTWKGIGWIHTYESGVNVITIGRPNVQDGENSTDLFTYGRGNGLTVLATSLSSQNDLATRIYPFGSTRNMIARYYNSKTTIKDYESVYIPNLMLPITQWGQTDSKYDPRKAYLENATAVSKYGLRPKRVYFDGSGDYEEIYPSIGGVTAKNIRDAKTAMGDTTYNPSTTQYTDSARMDEIKSVVSMPDDTGIMGSDGKKYTQVVAGSSAQNVPGTDPLIVPRMGETYAYSSPFGTATLSSGGKLTIKCDSIRTITLNKNDNPSVRFIVSIYCAGSLVKENTYPADVYGSGNDRVFRLAFPDITFNLESGGSMSIVVEAVINANPGATYYDGQSSGSVKYYLQKDFADTFTVKLKQIGFDISRQQASISDGLCTLNMRSGMCGGRDFVVKSVSYNSSDDSWTAVCYRQEDSSLGQYFPNSIYPIAQGDQFVLTDLEMPELYINIAAARLYDAATTLLAKLSAPKVIYEPEIDAKVVAEYGDVLKEGMYMSVGDSELIGNSPVYVLIDTLTINENEANIPTYKVTLRDERYENTIARLTGEISRLNAERRASLYDAARNKFLNDTAGEDSGVPGVTLAYDGNVFNYADASTVNPTSIGVVANVRNIAAPVYQWEWFDGTDWNPIYSEESQIETSGNLTVSPTGAYFANNALVAKIRCRVGTTPNYYYSDTLTVTKITGGAGSSTFTLQLYQRSATEPEVYPTDDLIYDFATDVLEEATIGCIGDWSREVPDGTDPCYVIIQTQTSSGGIATYTPEGWGEIRPFVKNGQNGQNGTNGTNGRDGTNGQDAVVLVLDPPVLQVPTNASCVIPSGTPLPTGQATLRKGNSDATGVQYSLVSDQIIYYDNDLYTLNGSIPTETHDGVDFVWEYENENGAIILLSDDDQLIWDGDETTQYFTLINTDTGITINPSSGYISLNSSFAFYESIPQRSVVVNAWSQSLLTLYQATLIIAAQRQGNTGNDGADGTNGSNGYTTDRIAIYLRTNSGTPNKPSSNVVYNIVTGEVTSGSLVPWYLTMPTGTAPCYVSYYYISQNTNSTTVVLDKTKWTNPVKYVENPTILTVDQSVVEIPTTADGVIIVPTPSVNVPCHLTRGNDSVPSENVEWYLIGDSYIVVDGATAYYQGPDEYEVDGTTYYHRWEPDGGYPILYSVSRYPSAGSLVYDEDHETTDEVTRLVHVIDGISINSWGVITGTPTHIEGDAAVIKINAKYDGASKFAQVTFAKNKQGDRGFAGKVARGISEFSSAAAADPLDDYQGMDDIQTNHIYYDVVTYQGNLYYCKIYARVSGGTTTYARQITPGSVGSDDVWVPATNFKFVATDLLLAQNAFIDFLGSQGIYLKNGANVVGGGQGGNGVIWWAGSDNPANAPFKANADGTVVATSGTFGPYTLDDDGLTRTGKPSGNATLSAIYAMRHILMSQTQQGSTSAFEVSIGNSAFAAIQEMIYGRVVLSLKAKNATTGVALQAQGDIQRLDMGLNRYGSALTIIDCEQDEYDALVNDDLVSETTMYRITDVVPTAIYLGSMQIV